MKNEKELTDKELTEAVKHLDAACTILGMSFKTLFNSEDESKVIGFLMGLKGMFNGELEPMEDVGLWTPMVKPDDPKQLN